MQLSGRSCLSDPMDICWMGPLYWPYPCISMNVYPSWVPKRHSTNAILSPSPEPERLICWSGVEQFLSHAWSSLIVCLTSEIRKHFSAVSKSTVGLTRLSRRKISRSAKPEDNICRSMQNDAVIETVILHSEWTDQSATHEIMRNFRKGKMMHVPRSWSTDPLIF